MWRSPAMAAAASTALDAAGIGIDDVGLPRPVLVLRQLAALRVRRARHLAASTRAGSPSPAGCRTTAVRAADTSPTRSRRWRTCCAADPGAHGVVSGVGMHMTKHVFGVYSTAPGAVVAARRSGSQRALDAEPEVRVVAEHDGDATVAAYSVVHGRDGAAEFGRAGVRHRRRAGPTRGSTIRSWSVRRSGTSSSALGYGSPRRRSPVPWATPVSTSSAR